MHACVCVCITHCKESNPLRIFRKVGSLLLIAKITNETKSLLLKQGQSIF